MVWAATKTSVDAGLWWDVARWAPAGIPGANDYVEIKHNVAIDHSFSIAGLYVNGGILTANAAHTVQIKDAAGTHSNGAHILIAGSVTSGFNSAAIPESPFTITSVNATPTYPIRMIIAGMTADTRTLNFDYCELKNFAPSIGNHTNYLFFNTGNVTNNGILDPPTPIRRDQKIDEIYCEGRSYSRIYPEGGHAGVIELSGLIPWSTYAWQTLIVMRDARIRVSYIGQFCTMPKAIVESLRFGSRDGPYIPFNLTLIEDR